MIAISLLDVLVDIDRLWEDMVREFPVVHEAGRTAFIPHLLRTHPEVLLERGKPHPACYKIVKSIFEHQQEPWVSYWCPGERIKGMGSLANTWLRKYDLHGDVIDIRDSFVTFHNIWQPLCVLTTSNLIALQAAERCASFSILLQRNESVQCMKSAVLQYPDLIFSCTEWEFDNTLDLVFQKEASIYAELTMPQV